MKNIKVLKKEKDIFKFLSDIWKTPEFKESFDKRGWIYEKVKPFMSNTRFIAEPTNLEIEHSHFYSWFNVLILKEYPNKYVQDLYFLHEIIHISTMIYQPYLLFEDWCYKMFINELNASIETEVMVYKHLDIRSKTFDFPIWYDELDKDLNNSKNEIMIVRTACIKDYAGKNTKLDNKIKDYYHQNIKFFDIWKSCYNEVESVLSDFYKNNNITEFLSWLEFDSTDDVYHIPFFTQAKEFAEVYHKNYKPMYKKD